MQKAHDSQLFCQFVHRQETCCIGGLVTGILIATCCNRLEHILCLSVYQYTISNVLQLYDRILRRLCKSLRTHTFEYGCLSINTRLFNALATGKSQQDVWMRYIGLTLKAAPSTFWWYRRLASSGCSFQSCCKSTPIALLCYASSTDRSSE